MVAHEHRRRMVFQFLQLLDIFIFLVVLGIVAFDIFHLNRSFSAETHPSWMLFGWLVSSIIIWHLILSAARVYWSARLEGGIHTREILTGVSTVVPCLGALDLLFGLSLFNLHTLLELWVLTTIFMLISRVVLREFLRALRRKGRNLRFVVIVGNGRRASHLAERLRNPSTGYRVIGYVDAEEKASWSREGGIRYLGTVESLRQVLADNVIDEVFVTLPIRSLYDLALQTLRQCEEQGIPVRIPCDLFLPGISTQTYDVAAGVPTLSLVASQKPESYLLMKRVLDIVISGSLLLLLLPLFFFVAHAIKRDSPGPVFFIQKRVGLNKRLFPLFKFRTMGQNSEAMRDQLAHMNEAQGPVFKISKDPRVTTFGQFLRKTSIDELPQLINVLRGDMSLVGPRPLPLRDVEGFTIDWQRRRFSIRPGITCLWQVSGRSDIGFDQWMALDLKYINERSFSLDLRIMLRTIPAVLRQTGAH